MLCCKVARRRNSMQPSPNYFGQLLLKLTNFLRFCLVFILSECESEIRRLWIWRCRLCIAQGSAGGLWSRGSNAVHINTPAFDSLPPPLVCFFAFYRVTHIIVNFINRQTLYHSIGMISKIVWGKYTDNCSATVIILSNVATPKNCTIMRQQH